MRLSLDLSRAARCSFHGVLGYYRFTTQPLFASYSGCQPRSRPTNPRFTLFPRLDIVQMLTVPLTYLRFRSSPPPLVSERDGGLFPGYELP